MPKHEKGTPKAIAAAIKAKGLGKLKFYCEMCSKQCRDENGFKCHCTSESHIRQMSLFAQNPDSFMDAFSSEFESTFLELLSRRFGTRRVLANLVYNEYITDKLHTHMNATIWPTLTDFVLYLGRTGKAVIDETERGWHITWINRDPELVRRQEAADRRKDADLEEEAARELELERLADNAARAAAAAAGREGSGPSGPTELRRGDAAATSVDGATGEPGAPVAVRITLGVKPRPPMPAQRPAVDAGGAADGTEAAPSQHDAVAKRRRLDVPEDDNDAAAGRSGGGSSSSMGPSHASGGEAARIAQEEMGRAAAAAAARPSRFDRAPAAGGLSGAVAVAVAAAPAATTTSGLAAGPSSATSPSWLSSGIVVKVLNDRVGGGAFYKAKGVVARVSDDDPYVAVVRTAPTAGGGQVLLKIDAAELQTVLPAIGGAVRVVAGSHSGAEGELLALHEDRYCADVRLRDGRVLLGVEYEQICKLA